MLRLSKKADYALIAMKHLALRGDRGSSSAREIAGMYDIPIELMAKVLQRLVQRGLLASHQGTRGGYQLARTPAQITVADVIQAIEGPVTVTACSTEEGQCEQFSKCNVRDPLYRVRDRILATVKAFQEKPVDAARLDAVRKRLRYQLALSLDSSDAIAGILASFIALRRSPETLNKLYDQYAALTPEDVQKAASKYLVENSRTIVTLTPAAQGGSR